MSFFGRFDGEIHGSLKKVVLVLPLLLLVLFFLYSGGEPLAFITLLLILFTAYTLVRCSFRELHLEKLYFFVIGVSLVLISVFGFFLNFLGFNFSITNYFLITCLSLIGALYLTKRVRSGPVLLDSKRFILISGCFLLVFFVYLWPSLPGFNSPTTHGSDSYQHVIYSVNIYLLDEDVLHVNPGWLWYPNGFHTTVAFLTHALESNVPWFNTFIYPFISFVSALIVGMLCSVAYDRVKPIYVAIFMFSIATSAYPLSALIGYGFWSFLFGSYFIVLLVLAMPEYLKDLNHKLFCLLVLMAFSLILAYQTILLPFLLILFSWSIFRLTDVKLSLKLKTVFSFIFCVLLLNGLYTLLYYSNYIALTDKTFSTYEAIKDRIPPNISVNSCSYIDLLLEGGSFKSEGNRCVAIWAWVPPEKRFNDLLSKGLDVEKFINYVKNSGPVVTVDNPWILPQSMNYFGYLTFFLVLSGLLCCYHKKDYSLILIEGSLLSLLLYNIALKTGIIGSYLCNKTFYFFVYLATLYAVVGLSEVFSRFNPTKKHLAVLAVAIVVVSYIFNVINVQDIGLLIGQRNGVWDSTTFRAPLLEFNRYLQLWHSFQNIDRPWAYGLSGWLNSKDELYIKDWLVCGPFPWSKTKGIDIDYIGESSVIPVLHGKCGDNNWHAYRADETGLVWLYNEFNVSREYSIAYVSTYIYSPKNVSIDFFVGADDEAKLWVNSEFVELIPQTHKGYYGINKKVSIKLKSGWNNILFKVSNSYSDWRLYALLNQENLSISTTPYG